MISDLSVLKTKLFYFATIVSLVGHIIDIILLENSFTELIVNCIAVGAMFIFIILVRFTSLSENKGNLLLIYTIFFNVIASLYLKNSWENIETEFLKISLVYGILVLYAGFAIGRVHLFILGAIFVLYYLIITFLTQNSYLEKNMPLLIMLIGINLFTVNYIIGILNNYYESQQNLIKHLTESNELLKKQGDELNRLVKTKDKLLSIIGHDLRTPASSIMGFSDLIARKSEKIQSKSLKEYSKLIYQSANRLSILLSQLLDWARIQSGKRELNIEQVNVNQLIEDVIDLMHGTRYLKNINVEFSNNSEILLNGDKQMLLTVIRNLLTNALKYTPQNGEIAIKSEIIDSDYKFTISDSGIGMTKEKIDSIFNGQFIESTPGTENEKGTGLGMGIVIEYLKLHYGKIWAESDLGSGSTFYFSFPKR